MNHDDELFDVYLDTHGYGQPPTSEASTSGHASGHAEASSYNFKDDGIEPTTDTEHCSDDEDDNVGSEAQELPSTIPTGDQPRKWPEEEDEECNLDMGRSEILVSPPNSDDENLTTCGATSTYEAGEEFHEMDLAAPTLKMGMKFASSTLFREAVREVNISKGKDIKFKKNCGDKVVVICRGEKCKYRVYAAWMKQEKTFQIRSINLEHNCSLKYKNSQVNSRWIGKKLMEHFKSQPNIPIPSIYKEVNRKWNVDVNS